MSRQVAELKAANDCHDVAHRLGLTVKAKGVHEFIHCPVHDDQEPSCALYPDHFFCFTCGAWGDVIELVMRTSGRSFLQAKAYLEGATPGAERLPRPARRYRTRPDPPLDPVQWAEDRKVPVLTVRHETLWGNLFCHAPVPALCRVVAIGNGFAFLHEDGVKIRGFDGSKWSASGSQFTELYQGLTPLIERPKAAVLVEGETDQIALQFWFNRTGQNVAVYGCPSGVWSVKPGHIEWLDSQFDMWYLRLDADDAGYRATAKISDASPRQGSFRGSYTLGEMVTYGRDPREALNKGWEPWLIMTTS